MATTVNQAFSEFLRETVNLDAEVNRVARSSRDWLISQIHKFEDNVEDFPLFYTDMDIEFGSFARRTKIRELDDIDLMICIKALGATYLEYTNHIEITVPDSPTILQKYCYDNSRILNSRKIINKFVSSLSNIPNYEKAEIKRTQEAATLKLVSYTWNFDIVPCFFTAPESDGRTYYVIPDGNGHWKKTDPRKDREAVSSVNQRHNGNVLNAIRIMKYWNNRYTAPAMPSYLLETMIVHYYLNELNSASNYIDIEVIKLLKYITNSIFSPVADLKDIQGNLNNLSFEQQWKIMQKAKEDHSCSLEARQAKSDGDHRSSINLWKKIFGPKFPAYG